VPVKVPDVAQDPFGLSVDLLKIVKLVGHFLRYFTATFFMGNEPESGVPGTVSVKIIDPVFEGFFFDHTRER
jgi:hypothetical protein